MLKWIYLSFVLILSSSGSAIAQNCPIPATPAASMKPTSRADVRPDRQEQIKNGLAAKNYDVLTFGDSIMEGWSEQRLSAVFGATVFNAGFGQDGTEHLLWRLQSVNGNSQSPRYVLLLIGTNDIGYLSCDISWGIRTVVSRIHTLFPQAQVIVTGILPRGTNMLGGDDRIRAVNSQIQAASASAHFAFFNPHDAFLCDHKTPCSLFQSDFNLHLTKDGYDVLDEQLKNFLAQLK
jgi:lysophospholipase L1-like esterase